MQQRRCFKPIPKVPLRVRRHHSVSPAVPTARAADARAAIEAAEAFLHASAPTVDGAA